MTDQPIREIHEQNRLSWNAATVSHNSHKGDQAQFFHEGGTTLHPEDLELLGDIRGQSVVHLQCNSGQDTLSLVNLGATATGVDISDTAIEFARQLSADTGIPATFIRSDLYDWFESAMVAGQQFDIAFTSYGTICWLSDLASWGKGIANILKPGGRFVFIDFHPFSMMFEDENWTIHYPYGADSPGRGHVVEPEGVGDYVATSIAQQTGSIEMPGVRDFQNPYPSHEFSWGVADILNALIQAGLNVSAVREYPYSNSGHMQGMVFDPGGRWVAPNAARGVPQMLSIVAEH